MSSFHSQPVLCRACCQPSVCGIIPGCFSYCSTALWTLAIVNIKATFQTLLFIFCFFFFSYAHCLPDYWNKYLAEYSEWERDTSSGSGVVIGVQRLSHVQGNSTLQRSPDIVFVFVFSSEFEDMPGTPPQRLSVSNPVLLLHIHSPLHAQETWCHTIIPE